MNTLLYTDYRYNHRRGIHKHILTEEWPYERKLEYSFSTFRIYLWIDSNNKIYYENR